MSKSGSDAESDSPQVIDDAAFTRLVARGLDRADNVVTGDEAIEALGEVDPTPDAIEKLRERLAESGVTLDDAVPVAEEIEALLQEQERTLRWLATWLLLRKMPASYKRLRRLD